MLNQRMVNAVNHNFEFIVKPDILFDYGSDTAKTIYDLHIKTADGQDVCDIDSLSGINFEESMQSFYQLIYAAMKCPEPQEIRRPSTNKMMSNRPGFGAHETPNLHNRSDFLARKLSYQGLHPELIHQMCNSGINPSMINQFIDRHLEPVNLDNDIHDILMVVSDSENISQEKVLELKETDPRRLLVIYKTHLCKKFLEENKHRHLDRNSGSEPSTIKWAKQEQDADDAIYSLGVSDDIEKE